MAENNLTKIIDAYYKRKEATNKFQMEIVKAKIVAREKAKIAAAEKQAQERATNPQKYTPEQQYLRRRFAEENPIAALAIPEEGDAPGMNVAISAPASQVVQDPKTETFRTVASTAPEGAELQHRNLETKVQQMLSEGKRVHPAILNVLDLQRKFHGQQADRLESKEERLGRQQEINNLKTFGGTVDDNQLKNVGLDLESYAKAGGAVPIIDKDGKRSWQVIPSKQFEAKIAEGKWGKAEIDNFQDSVIENQRWEGVLNTAAELGIDENTLANIGEFSFEAVDSPIGVLSVPARFDLVGQARKDPKYTALKRQIELAFQAFRKRVTGAQASEGELRMLKAVIPSLKDRPGVFFDSVRSIKDQNAQEMQARLDLYKAFGRDTTNLEKFMSENVGGGEKPSGRIRVKSKDGKVGTIPAEQLEAALAEGYVKA